MPDADKRPDAAVELSPAPARAPEGPRDVSAQSYTDLPERPKAPRWPYWFAAAALVASALAAYLR